MLPMTQREVRWERLHVHSMQSWCTCTRYRRGVCSRNRSDPHLSVRCTGQESCGGLCVDEWNLGGQSLARKHCHFLGVVGETPAVGSAASETKQEMRRTKKHLRCWRASVMLSALRVEMKHGLPSHREFRGKETVPGVADELQTPPHRHGLKLCGTPICLSTNTRDSLPAMIGAWQETNGVNQHRERGTPTTLVPPERCPVTVLRGS